MSWGSEFQPSCQQDLFMPQLVELAGRVETQRHPRSGWVWFFFGGPCETCLGLQICRPPTCLLGRTKGQSESSTNMGKTSFPSPRAGKVIELRMSERPSDPFGRAVVPVNQHSPGSPFRFEVFDSKSWRSQNKLCC